MFNWSIVKWCSCEMNLNFGFAAPQVLRLLWLGWRVEDGGGLLIGCNLQHHQDLECDSDYDERRGSSKPIL